MRIVLATPLYPPEIGGPATYTQELALRLRKEHEVTIVAFADDAEEIPGTKLITVSKKIPTLVRLGIYFFVLLWKSGGADVIYVQNAVAAGLPAVLAGIVRRKPIVVKFVGDEAWERAIQAGTTRDTLGMFLSSPKKGLKIRLLFSIQKFVLNRASMVIPPSEFLKNILARYYDVPTERIKVNYNAFELSSTPSEGARIPRQILSAGRLVKWKGIDGIIRATTALKEQFSDIKLVIAGDGPERESLEKIARETGAAEMVEFKGKVTREDLATLQAQSEIFVLNSTYEGLPHVVLESFAARTPLIATNIGGTDEAVVHEKTGLFVEPGNDEQLARAISRLFTEKELRERLVRGGGESLKEKFSWDRHISVLLAVFQSLGQNRNS